MYFWISIMWQSTRDERERILSNKPNFRCIGISEAVRIVKANHNCLNIDGDVFVDGKVIRYFNMRLGIIEKSGIVHI